MGTTKNNNVPVVDLPQRQWMRFSPTISAASATLVYGDAANERYMYYINLATLTRYDTWTDSRQILSTPYYTPATVTAAKYSTYGWYRWNILSATINTIDIPGLTNHVMQGYKIRIVSWMWAGQERTITDITENMVMDRGTITATTANIQTDSTKKWKINQWVWYQLRIVYGSWTTLIKKILYNDATSLTVYDVNFQQLDPRNNTPYYVNTQGWAQAILPVTTAWSQAEYYIEKSTATVDMNWTIQPDASSSFVLLSWGLRVLSSQWSTAFTSRQFYDILADTWISKSNLYGWFIAVAIATDIAIERLWETAWTFASGTITSATYNSVVTNLPAAEDVWVNYEIRITWGTWEWQKRVIICNEQSTYFVSYPRDVQPDATSTFAIYWDTNAIYLIGNNASTMFKYNIEEDVWTTGRLIDNWVCLNASIAYPGQHGFWITTGTRQATSVTTLAAAPTAWGTWYKRWDIVSITWWSPLALARVETVSPWWIVTAVSLYAHWNWYTTGTGKATVAVSGVGTGLTVNITAVWVTVRVTTASNHNLLIWDVCVVKWLTDSVYNTSVTITGTPAINIVEYVTTAAWNMAASYANTASLIVDSTANRVPWELVWKLINVQTSGPNPANTTTPIQRITANTAQTITVWVAVWVAWVNWTWRYQIFELAAFGRDQQEKVTERVWRGHANWGSTTTLQDTSKNREPNQWAGYKVRFIAWPGAWLWYELTIISNTTDTLTYATQTFTPTAYTCYEIMDTYGQATGTQSTTTLQDTTKTRVVNQWAGKRLRMVGWTWVLQELIILSNTANTLTFAAVSAANTPVTANTCYNILGIPNRSTWICLTWLFWSTENKWKFMLSVRWWATNQIDKYDISKEYRLYATFMSPQSEQFTTWAMYTYDWKDSIYIMNNTTIWWRIIRLNLSNWSMNLCGFMPYGHSTVSVWNRFEYVKTPEGIEYLYNLRHNGYEFLRMPLGWF